MSDQNNDNQFDEFRSEDFPADEPGEETAPAAASGGNRNFMIGIGVIAAILILALVGMGVFAATVLPQSRARQATQAALVQLENQATAQAATQVAFDALQAQIVPTNPPPTPTFTSQPTRTPVVAQATMEPTARPGENKAETPDPTLLAAQLTAGTEQAGGGAPGTTPLAGGAARTATLAVLLTQAAANQTQVVGGGTNSVAAAAATATALPATGFADEVGLPGLFGLALGLIILIFLSRTLRLTTR